MELPLSELELDCKNGQWYTIENIIQYHSMVFASNKANGILNGIFYH